jgi:hypothetical protein
MLNVLIVDCLFIESSFQPYAYCQKILTYNAKYLL